MRMAGIWALIPLKAGADAKTRLSPVLDVRQRATLQHAMLDDMLDGLASSARLSGIALYGCDDASASFAARRGIAHLRQPDGIGDLNAALADGTRRLACAGAGIIAVLPGDLPLIEGEELDAVLADVSRDRHCAVVPDRWRSGTNGLIFPADAPPVFRFGPESFATHLAAGAAEGALPCRAAMAASLAFDIDTPADLDALRASPRAGRGRHSRALIDALAPQETMACP